MFQEQGASSLSQVQPALAGDPLKRKMGWHSGFCELLEANGFEHLHLPSVMPLSSFLSPRDGSCLLPPGPTFRDPSGVDWALCSDMTAFSTQFVRSRHSAAGDAGQLSSLHLKLGYAGPVFSYSGDSTVSLGESGTGHGLRHPHLESYEYGAEIVSPQAGNSDLEVMDLMVQSARKFGYQDLLLVVGHAGILESLSESFGQSHDMGGRSRVHSGRSLRESLAVRDLAQLQKMPGFKGHMERVVENCQLLPLIERVREALSGGALVEVVADPLLVRPQGFYSGVTFELYVKLDSGNVLRVGAGGRYDALFRHFDFDATAVGFKIADPMATGVPVVAQKAVPQTNGDESAKKGLEEEKNPPLCIAVPKGRLLPRVLQVFAAVGVEPEFEPESSRKLVIPSRCGRFQFLLVKNSDVPSYLDRGVADLGVAGSDVLEECDSEVFRPFTFQFGRTRLCLAGSPERREWALAQNSLTIATKYGRMAKRRLAGKGVECAVVPLQGSVELAGVLQMSDAIVDLVETGSTLRENGLVEFAQLEETRVHLLVSRGLHYLKRELLDEWGEKLEALGMIEAPLRSTVWSGGGDKRP